MPSPRSARPPPAASPAAGARTPGASPKPPAPPCSDPDKLGSRDKLEADTSPRGARQRAVVAQACALDDHLATAYQLKEAFRVVMAYGRAGDVATFIAALDLFSALCHGSSITPFKTAAGLLRRWRTEIVNYARTGGASNAWAEAVNHLIKNQKRQAHGYRTWEGFRAQIIWCYGEVIDPDTGEILPLRSLPRGTGATWLQPQFA
ncbi:MAG: ISL3 family transposase [Gaiellales bacterium]